MRIGIIGDSGLIGLSFALLCEKNGYEVTISDSNEDYVFNLNHKVCLSNEPMIQSMLFDTIKFSATTDNLELIKNSDMIFTFVSTPSSITENLDTTNVFEIINNFYSTSSLDIPIYDKKFIVGSVTNPGDVEQIQQRLEMFNIQVAYVPEFTSPGEIVKNFQQSEVILIGTEHQELSNQLIALYTKIQTTQLNVYTMSIKSAELTKLAISGLIATKITYGNMLGEVMVNLGLENEIGVVLSVLCGGSKTDRNHIKYGFGFGGQSLPKENRIFSNFINKLGIEINIPSKMDNFNREHSIFLKNFFTKNNPDKSIPFVMNHLTYKKGVNVMEESQQFQLCIDLLNDGYMLHIIESDEITKKLSSLSESYDNRLKFFKQGTTPQGYQINL